MKKVRIRSPIWWFGGKYYMINKLLDLIPPHHVYVEVFGGGGSLLFAKVPSPVEVYNDIDSGLFNFFQVLRDPEDFKRFDRLANLTPYSRREFNSCRASWDQCEDRVERAYRFFVIARQSFSGQWGKSWGYNITETSRGMSRAASAWLSTIERLPEVHHRIMQVQIECQDFRKIIPTYDTPETFFYCDPPYIPQTRKEGKYRCEMSLEDHQELVALLLQIKGSALLSGYQHETYIPLEQAGWQRIDHKTVCHAAGRVRGSGLQGKGMVTAKQGRTECIWASPTIPVPLDRENKVGYTLLERKGSV